MNKRYILIPFVSFTIFLVIILILYNFFLNSSGHNINKSLVVIPPGYSDMQIANVLLEKGIIKKKLIFQIINILKSSSGKLKAGEYLFFPGDKLLTVINRLNKGEFYNRRITIPEGIEINQILKIINNTPGLIGEINEKPIEGSILPETYFFYFNDTKLSLIKRMTKAMIIQKEKAWENRSKNSVIKNADEMIVLASIIEEESGINKEKRIISGVFNNRIRKNMLLQSDPTVIYGLFIKEKRTNRKLSRQDLKSNTIWNTYLHKGLPPTPISNPGIESILAAVDPEKNDFLYFVADGKGGHNFSKTLKQHNKNVKIWKDIINCKKKKNCK